MEPEGDVILEKKIPKSNYKTKGELYRIERETFNIRNRHKKVSNNNGINGLNLKNDRR